MKTCHYNTKKNRKKQKKQGKYMSKCENIEIPVRVFRHLWCFTKPAYVSGTGFDPYPYGCGFRGYGSGLDHTDPCQTCVPPYMRVRQHIVDREGA